MLAHYKLNYLGHHLLHQFRLRRLTLHRLLYRYFQNCLHFLVLRHFQGRRHYRHYRLSQQFHLARPGRLLHLGRLHLRLLYMPEL